MFSVAGDSMLFVDKRGRRVVNEKLPYNELGADVLRVGRDGGRVPEPRARPGLGPAQPGALGLRRVRAADRRRDGPTTRTSSRARRSRSSQTAVRERARAVRARDRRPALADDWAAQPRGERRPLQRLAATGVDDATSAAASAPSSSSSTATCARSRAARTRRCGRSPTAARTTPRWSPAARWTPRAARRPTPTGGCSTTSDQPIAGPVRRRQLRRGGVAPRLLGGRSDDRADDRLRLPRGAGRGPEPVKGPALAGAVS